MSRIWRMIGRFVIPSLLGALVAFVVAPAIQAQNGDDSVYFRVYYSPYFSADVKKSPADPDGKNDDEPLDWSDKLELELVLMRHFGVSASRIRFARSFEDSGQEVNESASGTTLNLTLYGSPVAHNAWNVFIGTGFGTIEKYRIRVDGTRIDESPLHRNLQLQRNFAGIEYSFDRLGVRYEINQIKATNSSNGQEAELDAVVQYFTFFIPLN